MKKVLSFILYFFLFIVVTIGYLVWDRYQNNIEQIVPYPYEFQQKSESIVSEAPILIIGDRMGNYLSRFSTTLASVISKNLDKPIKIQSMAKDGFGLHRTLHQMRSLAPWPKIILYHGASEEFYEDKFNPSEIIKIKKNFNQFKDERIETAIILYPKLSRIIYHPTKRVSFSSDPNPNSKLSESEYLNRLETALLVFENELTELINLSKERNSLLVLTTTPINYDIPPRKSCSISTDAQLLDEMNKLKELKQNDLKAAYSKSGKMVNQFKGNAELYFIHGMISREIGNSEEALDFLKQAAAFDCEPWRATEVFNSIIRKLAKENQIVLFDFALLLEGAWTLGPSFFDDVYPQNLYYEKASEQLGLFIKDILKL